MIAIYSPLGKFNSKLFLKIYQKHQCHISIKSTLTYDTHSFKEFQRNSRMNSGKLHKCLK